MPAGPYVCSPPSTHSSSWLPFWWRSHGGLAGAWHTTLIGIPFVILYVGIWSSAFGAYNAVTLGLLAITWTLAIEEQYYLLWPLALSTLLKRMHHRRIAVILVAVALAEEVLRSGLDLLNKPQLYNWLDRSTLTHSDGLLIGSAFALMYTCRGQWKAWPAIRGVRTLCRSPGRSSWPSRSSPGSRPCTRRVCGRPLPSTGALPFWPA